MAKIDFLSITTDGIRSGKLKTVIPELYELEEATENNAWHLQQNVFKHTIGVFEGLQKVLNSFTPRELDEKVGSHTRREILVAATLLHDIAKTAALVKNPDGTTSSPGHEVLGSFLAGKIAERLGLNRKDREHLRFIILYHGFVHDILTLSLKNGNADYYFKLLREVTRPAYAELLMLAYADLLGSDLKRVAPENFKAREKLLSENLTAL